jgi:hypothetical protein
VVLVRLRAADKQQWRSVRAAHGDRRMIRSISRYILLFSQLWMQSIVFACFPHSNVSKLRALTCSCSDVRVAFLWREQRRGSPAAALFFAFQPSAWRMCPGGNSTLLRIYDSDERSGMASRTCPTPRPSAGACVIHFLHNVLLAAALS